MHFQMVNYSNRCRSYTPRRARFQIFSLVDYSKLHMSQKSTYKINLKIQISSLFKIVIIYSWLVNNEI